ncbi:hypothetical protein T12_1257 [Trichinella patagoniensis]|uniref:Uncharacterized protein n=1 Tax=Trichinella patagoniensis TaxID=990121 RepID=A0A0V0YZA4_9BILA|nr:hypothetical protein T12_5318 [Trichinella patagoniensis]KRY05631.1 hypothetical protein T12_1257 [Trichinella patagoniensis]
MGNIPFSFRSIDLFICLDIFQITSSILLEFTLSQHCNTSRQESWRDFESGKDKASTLLRTANERTKLPRHTATRNCSAFEAALLSFHSVICCKESTNGRY